MSSLVVVKFPAETKTVVIDFSADLAAGDSITSASVGGVTPPTLAAAVSASTASTVSVTVSTGVDLQSYGVTLNAVTLLGSTLTKQLAVVCNDQLAANYQNVNPDAFATLVGSLEVGQAALGTVAFMFPANYASAGGVVTWELLDRSGTVYSSGVGFNYLSTALPNATRIEAQAVINVPSNVSPTLTGQDYQVKWTLALNGVTFNSFESLTVTAKTSAPVGSEDVVELEGSDATVAIVYYSPYEVVTVDVYTHSNELLASGLPSKPAVQLDSGWLYTAEVEASVTPLPAQLEPYTLVWAGRNSARPSYVDRQTGRLFIVTPSMLQAVADLRLTLNKSRATIAHEEDLLFTEAILLSYLRSGRDYFNGAGLGMLTAFTMANAQGAIREFWLRSSLVSALRAQYLAEGEKAFNFSGQAISLDVDRTQYYQGLAETFKSELDQELKPFKQNLIKKGIVAGDGNLDPTTGVGMRKGALGTVGITLTPANSGYKWNSRWRM